MHTSVNQFDPNGNYSNDLSAERLGKSLRHCSVVLISSFSALDIMETWKNYRIPTASDLFSMIPHEENPSDEVKIDRKRRRESSHECLIKISSEMEKPIVEPNDRVTKIELPFKKQVFFSLKDSTTWNWTMGTTTWTINLPYSPTSQPRCSIRNSTQSMSGLWPCSWKRLSSSISILRIYR